ncbi:hypothetical protein QA601_02360 [Chitinispirillales bacterium ANBcel5]|uniref:hypothetical protein n=1 Tax=Cellulosispirillum alkaliphilum TaxID=3039283 RepID=UPI002A556A40|nr:hypothetical protein [Chitinispirillales bacterium ANBcel5]
MNRCIRIRPKLAALIVIVLALKINGEQDGSIVLPTFETRVSAGFNYDLLRSPLNVSFQYPVGYFGFNLPVNRSVNLRNIAGRFDPIIDTLFNDTTLFKNGEEFKPTGVAAQSANNTIRVDVPMLNGVGSFAYTQNFSMNYHTFLGNPYLHLAPDSLPDELEFMLRGTVNAPVSISMGWETMTFGYAYELNRNVSFAFNLHRHLFNADLRGRVDIDLLGSYSIDLDPNQSMLSPIHGELDYPSDRINGYALGNYKAQAWTPTFGVQLWRLSLVSRFGLQKEASGSLRARYIVPSFIDPETFQMKYDLEDPDQLLDPEVRDILLSNAIDSVGYSTDSKLHWRIPHGHTLAFDVWPGLLSLSYTKIYGDIELGLDNIHKEQRTIESAGNNEGLVDSLDFDVGISVDHVIMLHGRYRSSFLNFGIFAFDVRYNDMDNLVGGRTIRELKIGDAAMMPILSLGSAFGSKIQVLVELDVLPLPAFKTGLFYHF